MPLIPTAGTLVGSGVGFDGASVGDLVVGSGVVGNGVVGIPVVGFMVIGVEVGNAVGFDVGLSVNILSPSITK